MKNRKKQNQSTAFRITLASVLISCRMPAVIPMLTRNLKMMRIQLAVGNAAHATLPVDSATPVGKMSDPRN